jgi:hypothetical protein
MGFVLSLKIFKSPRGWGSWVKVIECLYLSGYKVFNSPRKCDISIVLGGKVENPEVFCGEKILIFHDGEWKVHGPFFKEILSEYYDLIVDVTGLHFRDIAKKIGMIIYDKTWEADKQGSTD